MPETLLTCSKLAMQYDKTAVLEDVSFTVARGDCLCVVGENGSGKSTLLKGILGLHPLKSGSVTLADGVSRRALGYLPQQTTEQRDFPAHVGEIVRSGRLNRGFRPFYSKDDRRAAREAMETLQIADLAKRSYRALSGGQQQRVLLARALCAAQELLLLDEPVTGLDPVVTADFYALVQKLNREMGLSVVMVSHDIAGAVQIANRILHMDKSVAFFGSTQDYAESTLGKHFMKGCCHCD